MCKVRAASEWGLGVTRGSEIPCDPDGRSQNERTRGRLVVLTAHWLHLTVGASRPALRATIVNASCACCPNVCCGETCPLLLLSAVPLQRCGDARAVPPQAAAALQWCRRWRGACLGVQMFMFSDIDSAFFTRFCEVASAAGRVPCLVVTAANFSIVWASGLVALPP